MPTDCDSLIAACIRRATAHVKRITGRQYVAADRVERVNQLMVSLRRELQVLGRQDETGLPAENVSDLVSSLCRKELWFDAGVLQPWWRSDPRIKYSREQIEHWCQIAKRMASSVDLAKYDIEPDLEELGGVLAGCVAAVEDAKKINEEGEMVAAQLCQLFDEQGS